MSQQPANSAELKFEYFIQRRYIASRGDWRFEIIPEPNASYRAVTYRNENAVIRNDDVFESFADAATWLEEQAARIAVAAAIKEVRP